VQQRICFFICPLDEEGSQIRLRSQKVLDDILIPALKTGFEIKHFLGVNKRQEIKEEILHYIATADLCVADLTGANPNVLYEYGRRTALNRPSILLTANRKTIPFDLLTTSNIAYKLENPAHAIQAIRELVKQMEEAGDFDPPARTELHPERMDQTDYICNYITKCRPRKIDVLQVSLMALGNDFLERVRKCSNVMLRILLIDPEQAAKFSLGNFHAQDVERVKKQIEIIKLETERKWRPSDATVGLWYYKHQPIAVAVGMVFRRAQGKRAECQRPIRAEYRGPPGAGFDCRGRRCESSHSGAKGAFRECAWGDCAARDDYRARSSRNESRVGTSARTVQ
jgi:hypothetical protein